MELYYNGYIKIRNRKFEMKWTGQYATHVLENYLKKDGLHNLTHIEIQRVLKVSTYTKLHGNKYKAKGYYRDKHYIIIFGLTNKKQAVIQTCYRYK